MAFVCLSTQSSGLLPSGNQAALNRAVSQKLLAAALAELPRQKEEQSKIENAENEIFSFMEVSKTRC